MNTVKGFRFHPTDKELIEFLHLKTFDRDSFVQVIDEVSDICLWEPCQLAERSTLQTGDRLWYFIYSPKYKYHNSKRISRTTAKGYWKPTGNARKIIDPETKEVIGTKKTLVFYNGQCNDKKKIKTCWVMHEYELKLAPNTIDIDQKTYNLCKLKKRMVDTSSTDISQSSQHNDWEIVANQANIIDNYARERSNQHNSANDDVVSNLSSSFVIPEDAISKETLHLKEMSKECNGPKDDNGVQMLYSTIEKDEESCGSVLTNGDEHNVIVTEEGFGVPSSFEYLANNKLGPMDFQCDEGLSINELLEELEATHKCNWFRDQSIANIDNEFWNSVFADDLQEENKQQYMAAENEVSGLPCIGVMESSDSAEKPKKSPRLSHDVHVETTEARVGGSITEQK